MSFEHVLLQFYGEYDVLIWKRLKPLIKVNSSLSILAHDVTSLAILILSFFYLLYIIFLGCNYYYFKKYLIL